MVVLWPVIWPTLNYWCWPGQRVSHHSATGNAAEQSQCWVASCDALYFSHSTGIFTNCIIIVTHWETLRTKSYIEMKCILRKHWESIEKVLRKYWENIEKWLRKYWESIEKTLRKHWEMIEKVLRKHWEMIEKVLRKYWEVLSFSMFTTTLRKVNIEKFFYWESTLRKLLRN